MAAPRQTRTAAFDTLGRTRGLLAALDRAAPGAPTLGALCQEGVSLRQATVSKRTTRRHRATVADLVEPRWGDVPVTAVTEDDLDNWYASLRHPTDCTSATPWKAVYHASVVIRVGLELWNVRRAFPAETVVGYIDVLTPVWAQGRASARGAAGSAVAGAAIGSPAMVAGGAGSSIGSSLARARGRQGPKEGLAWQIPAVPRVHAYITDQSFALMSAAGGTTDVVWSTHRSNITGIRRNRHVQVLRRFRMRFADGSVASWFTPSRATVPLLRNWFGG